MRTKRLAWTGLALAIVGTALYVGADFAESDRMSAASKPLIWGAAYALGAASEAWRHATGFDQAVTDNEASPRGGDAA